MSRLPFIYRGLIVSALTPSNDDRSLNLDIILKYATYLTEKGIRGVLINSTYGEGMSMSVAERKFVTEAWVKAVKETKQHLMVQIGGAPLPDVIELARHANSLGVDSILCLPELYYKPTTPEQLIDYLKRVGQAAPETPLLYYHIPVMTNVNIHMGQFLESIGDKLPSFVGIKFTSTNLGEGTQALRVKNGKYVIFFGNDQLIKAAYALGMNSFISSSVNLFPECVLELLAACKKGNTLKAKNIQEKLSSSVIAITKHGAPERGIKLAMSIFSDIDLGPSHVSFTSSGDISSGLLATIITDLTDLGHNPNICKIL